jgi:hypothetical protein
MDFIPLNTSMGNTKNAGTRYAVPKKDINNFFLKNSIVLAPGVTALRAPEEPHFAFVGSPELAEPPDCKIVLALGTLDLDGGHGLFLTLLLNDHDLILTALYHALHLVSIFDLPDIPAFAALQLTGR